MTTVITPVFCDWLTAIAPDTRQRRFVRLLLSKEHATPIRKAYHRPDGVEYYPSGWKLYFDRSNREIDPILVGDGGTLGNIRSEHDNEWCSKTVALIARFSTRLTRIDLSLDILDDGETAHLVQQLTDQARLDFGRRKAYTRKDAFPSRAVTTYIGARTSPLFTRIYDKSAETKGKLPSTRVEFELKGERSEAVSSIIAGFGGFKSFGRLFIGLLNEITDWEAVPHIGGLVWGEAQVVSIPPKERFMDTKEWLRRQVLPTFTRDKAGKGQELWQWFKQEVERELPTA